MKIKKTLTNEPFPYLELPPEVRKIILGFLTAPSDKLALATAIPADGIMMGWKLGLLRFELNVRKLKEVLPDVARFCLVTTFLEVGLRMCLRWNKHRDYNDASWKCGYLWATLFLLINVIGQLSASVMVLRKLKVGIASGILIVIVLLQVVGYNNLWNFQVLMRNLSVIGALLLNLAESRVRSSILAGVSLSGDKLATKVQLTGRILLVFMLFPWLLDDHSFMQRIIHNQAGGVFLLMVDVALGLKPKLSALMLVVWLSVHNFNSNAWWTIPGDDPMREFLQYGFFQTLSVIGGLLMVICLEQLPRRRRMKRKFNDNPPPHHIP